MGGYVVRFVGVSGRLIDRSHVPHFGDYLTDYDVDAHDGLGEACFQPSADKALVFSSQLAAMRVLHTQSNVRPTRADGRINKPLRAFNCTIEPDPLGRDA